MPVTRHLRMGTRRRRLPQGRSWPLRPAKIAEVFADLAAPQPSVIDKYVGNARAEQVHLTVLWNPRRSWSAEPWEGGDEHVRVQFNSVPSDVRLQVEQTMLAEAVPDLAAWLKRAS